MSVRSERFAPRQLPRALFGGAMSLERKLPLLMTAPLVVILTASLFLTYGTLTRSAQSAVSERLGRAARQVATTVQAAVLDRATRMIAVGNDPAVRRALSAGTSDAQALRTARAALLRLGVSTDSGLPIQLWDASGERILSVTLDSDSLQRGAASGRDAVAPLGLGLSAAQPDSTAVGLLYGVADSVFFWIVVPVREGDRHLGYIAQKRRVGGPRDATASLGELIGQDVTLYMRNETGSFWASAPGQPALPAQQRDSTARGLFHVKPPAGRMLAAEAAIGGTPWLVVLETPVRSVHTGARAMLLTLVLLSLMLTAVGAVASWLISRRVTQPLASLTTAAEAIARGDYSGEVESTSADEIGRLAASFNQMASEIASSRRELEGRITDAHATAEALERANVQLQKAMQDAEQARTEAERANRAKSDFLAVMSHELRTPLNAIAGYRQLLDLEVYGPVNESQRDALSRIARSQAHLLGLINDVLNFAKIDAGQVEYAIDDVPVDETLVALEELVSPQVRAKHLTFDYRRCDPRLTVRADREKLRQIVLNLVTNAVKFTPVGGRVELTCEATGEAVRILVRDSGMGIPAERLPWIFDPFVQVDRALNRPNEGVGLGLAISRDLARGMGGDVVAASIVGSGSVFTLSLPSLPTSVRGIGERATYEQQRA